MFWSTLLRLCSQKGTTPSAVTKDCGLASGSVTKWKNGAMPNSATREKLAEYFGITVEELLGYEKPKTADDVRVALFGGNTEVTDEMWDEVTNFVEYLKVKYKK